LAAESANKMGITGSNGSRTKARAQSDLHAATVAWNIGIRRNRRPEARTACPNTAKMKQMKMPKNISNMPTTTAAISESAHNNCPVT